MLDIDKIKKELMLKYIEGRAIPVNINISKCGSDNDEILIIFDTEQYSFTEQFKSESPLKDIFETMDKSIYREDYKYAYCELKKFWNQNAIDFSEFEHIFGDSLFLKKGDELLMNMDNYIFTVYFNDNDLSYEITKIYQISKKNDITYFFEELDKNLFKFSTRNEIEQGVIQLQLNRKKAKNKVDKSREMLLKTMAMSVNKIKNR